MKNTKGITLIALIITIIVMLILVAVSISVALNTGLFKSTSDATKNWKSAQDIEGNIGNGIEIGGKKYSSMEDYIKELDSKISIDYEIEKGVGAGKIIVTAQYKGAEPTDEEYVAYMKQKLAELKGTESEKLEKKQLLFLDSENFWAELNNNSKFESLKDALESYNYSTWEEFVEEEGEGNVDKALINFEDVCPKYWYLTVTNPDGTEEISMEDTLEPFTIEYEVTEAGEYEFTAKVFGKENSKKVVIKDRSEILIEKVEGNEADWEFTEEDDGTVTITKYLNTDTTIDTVIIPNYIAGKPVKTVTGVESHPPMTVLLHPIWNTSICAKEDFIEWRVNTPIKGYENTSVSNIIVSEGIENIGERYFRLFN